MYHHAQTLFALWRATKLSVTLLWFLRSVVCVCGGGGGGDIKRLYFGSRWLSEMVRSCVCSSHGSETGPEERLVRISYSKLNFSITNLMIFSYGYNTPARYLRNEIWKCSNQNQNGAFNVYSWYKLRLNFHCMTTIRRHDYKYLGDTDHFIPSISFVIAIWLFLPTVDSGSIMIGIHRVHDGP